MRKIPWLVALVVMTLAVGATFVLPQIARADTSQRIVTFDIVFDGYCDGMHMELDTETKLVTANRTGCDSGYMEGDYTPTKVRLVDNNYGLNVRIKKDGTWAYYGFDGTLWNYGTWSPAGSGATSGASSSTLR